jgi:MFS family permease
MVSEPVIYYGALVGAGAVGVGWLVTLIAAIGYVLDVDPRRVPRIIAVALTASVVGAAIGILVTPPRAGDDGWRLIALASGGVAFVLTLAWAVIRSGQHDSPDEAPAPLP